jgi:anti-sigma regulatory factor (Ser/Thr protein kinase)/biotin operon repressor
LITTKQKLLTYVKNKQEFTGSELARHLKVSRQAVHKILKPLIEQGLILKGGTTRGARYRIARAKKVEPISQRFRKIYPIQNLEEDRVFQECSMMLNLRRKLSRNAFGTVQYAFTEIVNNAIDHSHSKTCQIEASVNSYEFSFHVRDYGIGIFKSIADKYKLSNEAEAIGDLIKGKTTTMKEKHTGEGIFFTSKIADILTFRSHRITLIFENLQKDLIVEDTKFINGTSVFFQLSRQSKTKLSSIFTEYAPEEFDYKFEKTRVMVELFKADFISRSEARRLLQGLDQFREVVLDFSGVRSLGQGFVDEIFRVFQKNHPEIEIKIENLRPNLAPLIRHVVDKSK